MAALGSVCVAAVAALQDGDSGHFSFDSLFHVPPPSLRGGEISIVLSGEFRIDRDKRVAVVSYLIELSAKSMQAARGSIDGKAFEIELGEPVFWFLFLLAGVFLLGIVTGVAKALVSTGISLIQPALAELRRPNPPA